MQSNIFTHFPTNILFKPLHNILYSSENANQFQVGPQAGGEGVPIMTSMGKLHPKSVPFSGFGYKKVGISQIEVYEKGREIWVSLLLSQSELSK